MAGVKRQRRTPRVDELPESWYWALALGGEPELFGGEAERRAAWFKYRALIEVNPCHRPWGWWEYEAPERRNEGEHEHEQLERLGVLSPEERAELAEWRGAGVVPKRRQS